MSGFLISLACVIGILLFLFFGIQAYSYSTIWLSGRKLRKELKSQGRTISLNDAKSNIRNNQGILIVDAPTLGWNVSRVWWSPDVDYTPRPDSWDESMVCPEQDIENYRKFIEQPNGKAKLIDPFVITQRVKDYMKKHFGTGCHCFVFTGGVLFQKELQERNVEQENPADS